MGKNNDITFHGYKLPVLTALINVFFTENFSERSLENEIFNGSKLNLILSEKLVKV